MDIQLRNDAFFMKEALKEAQRAYALDEVPVGAVVVHKNRVIARAHNQVEMLKDPTAHAEMLVLTEACSFLGNKWLLDCSIYVTIEPCSMCAGALVLSRLKKIVYGARDPKAGACGSILNIVNNKKLNHRIEVKRGILEKDCSLLLKDFFLKKRRKSSSRN
ncbi:MAG: tRNA adenosine(34) deaminase TadA [Candidatus Omnitrophica bacterium]|nr:tRNA adenosine(34) deaminase TadA [Candidatus Omnitrophota bacterium]MDD5355495.1 tRNA adenosine(34) deaminase TadA [Candidatus Omnitrophota bacterium]